jgi:hypothetical protein
MRRQALPMTLALKPSALFRHIWLAACLFSNIAFAASWTVSVDQRHGLPAISRSGGIALSSQFVFWGKDWAWAGQRMEFKVAGPFDYIISGKNRTLNFDLMGRIRKSSSQQLVWEFDLHAPETTADVIGGGISFRFNLASFGQELGEPELLQGNRGWIWGRAGGSRVEMRFDPPPASVYFERGQKGEVRVFFYKDEVPQGNRRYTAKLNVSGDIEIGTSAAERFGLEDHTAWPTDILDWETSPVDLSYLNATERPAGKRGFVKVVKDRLVFEDGTPARFWGTNLTAHALFGTTRENVKRQARRLSELGFNLVRLHHHDSPWVNPNIFGERQSPDTQNLSTAMLEKLDWWIKCLMDEGIYVWLDLHVQRHLRPGDQIDGFEEISRRNPLTVRRGHTVADLKGYNYVNPSIQQAMKRFNESYVNHRNVYTNTRYKDQPAIVAMLITNENDVTHHFGNALLPDKNVPKHNAVYMAQAEAFAQKHGLPKNRTWRSWEPGPSKLFLNDLEQRFNAEMIAHLRAQGVKVPIVTTSTWGFNPLSSLPALTTGNMIDAHSYGGAGELEKNPVYAPSLVHWLAAAQVAGKPLSVTEWNVSPFPAPDRHSAPLYVAAAASHQGWSALMQYAYSQVPLNGPGSVSNWHAFNDPALIATLPAAALMYRQGHVQEASTIYAFVSTKEQFFNESISAANAAALRTAAEKGKLVIALPHTAELPWLEKSAIPVGAKVITDPSQSLFNSDAAEAVSDTGELRRNWGEGTYTINTPRTQAATGWIGGKKISLADVGITAITRNATVAVQSLDQNPISKSRALLISLGARSVPKSQNQLPFHSEPVEGQLIIRAPKGLKLYKKTKFSDGKREIPATYEDGRYLIILERSLATYWLLLQ